VELNPVRAGLVSSADSYRWCSYHAHACGAADPLVTSHAIYDALANTGDRRQEAWRHICAPAAETQQLEDLRNAIATGVVGKVVRAQILQP